MSRTAAFVMRLMGKRSCEDVVSILHDYYEGTLEPKLATILEQHLRDCPNCTAFARTYREVIKLTGELSEDEIPEEVRLRVRRALRERMRL